MVVWLVNTFPSWVLAIAVIAGCVGFAAAATYAGRRLLHRGVQDGHNDVGGSIMQTVGGVYAVLLALVVIALWEDRTDVDAAAARESAFLTATFRDVGGLAPEFAADARAKIAAYTKSVVSADYPALRKGGASDATRDAYNDMFATIRAYESKGLHEQMLYAEALRELNESSEARTERLTAARGGLPPVFWAVLITSTALTLGLGGLLWMQNARHHHAIMAVFAANVGVLLFLVVVLDHPFAGDFGIAPDAFEQALDSMDAAR